MRIAFSLFSSVSTTISQNCGLPCDRNMPATEFAPACKVRSVTNAAVFDAFDIFNHNNLSNPGTSLGLTTDATHAFFNAPGFGLITGSASNRFLQIVTRLNF